jgi:hypothetical protein
VRLDVDGEPIHTRAQSVLVTLRPDGRLDARGSLLDLRTRGFLPIGGSMQGMGIIHHMELGWTVDPTRRVVEDWAPSQPTVAFEATPETAGESCRDPIDRVASLADVPLGSSLSTTLRERIGGPLGCSHLVTLGLFMDAAIRAGLDRRDVPSGGDSPRPLWRRDLVFDAHEQASGEVRVGMRQGDLDWNDRGAEARAPERFARHHELVGRIDVDLWPGTLLAVHGVERARSTSSFIGVGWTERDAMLAPLAGTGLARGAAGEMTRRLGAHDDVAPWRDAFVMLPPALVQCRAAHTDAWHEKVRASERHPGLTALPDSCYMWRRSGALERIRNVQGAGKGGR